MHQSPIDGLRLPLARLFMFALAGFVLLAVAPPAHAASVAGLVRSAAGATGAKRARYIDKIVAKGAPVAGSLLDIVEKAADPKRKAQATVAAEALGRIGGKTVAVHAKRRFARQQRRPTEKNGPTRRLLLRVFARAAGPDGVRLVAQGLHDEHVRSTAEEELRRLGPAAARELVIAAYQHPPEVQQAAIRVLKSMPEVAAPMIVPLFQRPSDHASRLAGLLLAELKDPTIVPQLVALIRERRAHDEGDVLRALAIYDAPEARAAIGEALASPFPYMRYPALQVIRGWDDDARVLGVRDRVRAIAAQDETEQVQTAAVRTLLAHWDTGAEDVLMELLDAGETRPDVRLAAAEAAGFLFPVDRVDDVVDLMFRGRSEDAWPALRRALRRMTFRPETTAQDGWNDDPPVADELPEAEELERVVGLPEGTPAAWQLGDNGSVVLVLAGLPTFDHRVLTPHLAPLAESRRIVAVDIPAPRDGGAGWEQDAMQGVAALQQALGAEKVSLLGHGVGAVLALRYAAVHPDRVERLALLSLPGLSRSSWESWQAGVVRGLPAGALQDLVALRTGWKGSPPRSARVGLWRVMVAGMFAEPLNAVYLRDLPADPELGRARLDALGPFDLRAALGSVSMPVLLLVGKDDPVADAELADYRMRFEQTDGRFSLGTVPGARHFPLYDNPIVTLRMLKSWLSR